MLIFASFFYPSADAFSARNMILLKIQSVWSAQYGKYEHEHLNDALLCMQAAAEKEAAASLPQVSDKDKQRIDKLKAKEEAAARAAFEVGPLAGSCVYHCTQVKTEPVQSVLLLTKVA